MKIFAPAKINIVLRVLGQRANGYHDLLMLNEKLAVADEIEIEVRGQKSEVGRRISDIRHQVVVTCDDPTVPCDETNLCYKAAKALLCHSEQGEESHERNCLREILRPLKRTQNDIKIHIKKRIPVAAGLGGGSSDAAAVLKGLNELLNLNLPYVKLAELGVKLGADVPFFLYDGPAICEGIGDKITTLSKLPKMWILLINPSFPVSTKWVYEEFDKIEPLRLTDKNSDVSNLARNFNGLRELTDVVHNDLELVTATRYPEIEQIKKFLTENDAVCSWMSGSGPTVVGMFDSEKTRDNAFGKLNRPEWKVIKTVNF